MKTDTTIKKPPLDEIATTQKDLDTFAGYINRLENPDPVLLTESNGKGLKLYDEVDRDPHAGAVLQTRYLSVVGKEWEILPGGSNDDERSKMIAKFVKDVLLDVNFNQVRQEILQAILYGYYPAEILWVVKNGKVVPGKIVGKHPRRFSFTMNRELRLLTPSNMVEGEKVPDRKFIVFSYGSSDNPYGKGIGQKLWWPVWFKKHGIKFWLIFLEKFGMPTAIGKYPSGTGKKQQQMLLEAIDALQTETGVKIPDSMAIELLEAKRSGKVTYETICDYMDCQISKAVLGQTLTTEVKGGGSYAASQTHNDVREDILKADADLLCECLNATLIPWIVDYNWAGVTDYPKCWIRVKDDECQKELAERDKIVVGDLGVDVAMKYFYEKYNIPEPSKGEKLVNLAVSGSVSEGKEIDRPDFTEFSEQGQDNLDSAVKKSIHEAIPVFKEYLDEIREFLLKAKSLKAADKKILKLWDTFDRKKLAKVIASALYEADQTGVTAIMGNDFAEAEAQWGPGNPFANALEYFQSKAFTISDVSSADLLMAVKKEIVSAMEEGTTIKEFRQRVATLFEKGGYEALAPFHIDTIFRTNMQIAYQAGRYRQMRSPAVLMARPYWRYVAVLDGSTRPEHAAMHGKIYKHDHSYWDTWFPPNGFRCRCYVQTVSAREIDRNGWSESKIDPTGGLFEPVDPVTGMKFPARPLMPDNGWDYNPVADAWKPDLTKYPKELSKKIGKEK